MMRRNLFLPSTRMAACTMQQRSSAGIECSCPFLGIEGISSTCASLVELSRPLPGRKLLGEIGALILACVDINISDVSLIAAFVMSSWFVESLTVAPYLALVGLPRSGKTTLLQVLNQVCRRPLLTGDITSAAFYDVYEKLSPTLLVDETLTAGNRRELFHLLKTGTTRGSVTLRKGQSLSGLRSQSNHLHGTSERCGFEQPMRDHSDAGNNAD